MPISKKIINEIGDLSITDKEKKLLIEILELEDAGNSHYSKRYEEVIDAYLNNNDTDKGEN